MALNDTVQAAVNKAFSKVDSLLVPVIFKSKSSVDFDFASKSVIGGETVYSTKGFLETKKKWVDGVVATRLTLMVKTLGVEFNGYSSVEIDSKEYSFSISEGNQFVTIFTLAGR